MADSNIQELLNAILNTRLGKDMRQAIHDGIEQCYEDGKVGAVDLVARQRIDNLSKLEPGSTTGDAELRDIRIGYDGTEYETAGEAVRGQIGLLSEDITEISRTYNLIMEQGGIDPNTGNNTGSESTRIRSSIHFFPKNAEIYFDVSLCYILFEYSREGTYIGVYKKMWESQDNSLIVDKEGYYRLLVRVYGNHNISPDDYTITVNPTANMYLTSLLNDTVGLGVRIKSNTDLYKHISVSEGTVILKKDVYLFGKYRIYLDKDVVIEDVIPGTYLVLEMDESTKSPILSCVRESVINYKKNIIGILGFISIDKRILLFETNYKIGEVKAQAEALEENLSSVNKLLGETTMTVYNNLEEITEGTIANTSRWFLQKTINAYTLIDDITLSSSLSVGKSTDIIVTLWKKANNTLTKICDKEISYTEVGQKKIVVSVNEIPKSDCMISVWTSAQASLDYISDMSSTYYTKDLSSETLNIEDLSSYNNLSIKCKISTRRNYIGISGSILTVGINKQYETIQEAIDNANDSELNPVTIIVFPGIYEPFSMVGFPFVTDNNRNNKLRYLSIIGIDRFRTFIIDHVGDYRRPPAEIRTRGCIANLQFITDHTATSDDSDWDESEVKRRAYGIHMDFGPGQKVVIKNCIIKSAHAPAIGIGLYQDDSITIDDCELYSTADNSFGGMRDYGALYCHSCNVPDITNQYINIKNSIIESQNSQKGGAFFQLLQNGKAYLKSINTMYCSINIDSPKATNSGFALQPQSYGNNFDEFNA